MEYTEIGRLGKTHGYEGALRLHCSDDMLEVIANVRALFYKKDGQFVPLFIEYLHGKALDIVKFDRYDSKESARELTNQPIYALAELVEKKLQSGLDYAFLRKWHVMDMDGNEIGVVSRVEAYPSQEMAIVRTAGGMVNIPLVEAFIYRMDKDNFQLIMDLPEGLLDL